MVFSLIHLPDEVISKILQTTDYTSCRRLMRCSRRLNTLVKRDELFRRDDVYRLECMVYPSCNHMLTIFLVAEKGKQVLNDDLRDRYTFNDADEPSRTRETNERIAFNLSKVRSVKTISFVRVTINEEFLQVLLGFRFHLGELKELDFIDCNFAITEEQLKKIVSIPTLKCLDFTSCKFNFQLRNSTFSCWKIPQKLEICNLQGLEFTDEFLNQYSENPDFSLVLTNCETKFSVNAIIKFIATRSSAHDESDFGIIEGSPGSSVDVMKKLEDAGIRTKAIVKRKRTDLHRFHDNYKIGDFTFSVAYSR